MKQFITFVKKCGSPEAMRMEPPLDPPHDCSDDGHDMRLVKSDPEGGDLYRCRYCRKEELV